MNTFTANIQREWLARILAGSKKIEYRDATDYWLGRLERAGPPPFHLRLINGMKKDSPEARVTVDEVDIELVSGTIRLHLGQIVSTTRWDNRWNTQYPAVSSDIDVPETPLVPADPSITLEAPAPLIEGLRSPGAHAFDLPIDDALVGQLSDYRPEPFFIRLTAPTSQSTVLAYKIYWQCYDDKAHFLILTPRERHGKSA
jgi:hypothetical protein